MTLEEADVEQRYRTGDHPAGDPNAVAFYARRMGIKRIRACACARSAQAMSH